MYSKREKALKVIIRQSCVGKRQKEFLPLFNDLRFLKDNRSDKTPISIPRKSQDRLRYSNFSRQAMLFRT